MGIFGWSYPPGCHGTPYDDEQPSNDIVKAAFADFESLYDLYRGVYKSTDCGPTIGVVALILEDGGPEAGSVYKEHRLYNSDLAKLPDWDGLDRAGTLIHSISVSSIVEGSDAEIPPVTLTISDYEDEDALREAFYAAVKTVNDQAGREWRRANRRWTR